MADRVPDPASLLRATRRQLIADRDAIADRVRRKARLAQAEIADRNTLIAQTEALIAGLAAARRADTAKPATTAKRAATARKKAAGS